MRTKPQRKPEIPRKRSRLLQNHIIMGDSTVYYRICQTYAPNVKQSVDRVMNRLLEQYPEYRRKKRDVFRKMVEIGMEFVTKTSSDEYPSVNENSNDYVTEDDDTEVDDSEDKKMDTKQKTSAKDDLVNNSLNQLYACSSQTAQQKSELSSKQASTSTSLIKQVNKCEEEKSRKGTSNEEQKASSVIDKELAKQVKLREKYLLKPKISFADFGGIHEVIVELKRLVFHIRNSDLYRELGVDPPRGFLLHGPPGVGKSLLVEALANDLQIPCLRCGATEIIAGISGESEEKIRELFSLAKSLKPCLLFFDEIDAITPKRANATREMERRIVTQLLTCLDQLSDSDGSGDGVMIVGATNRVDSLDPALRRAGRFDREIALGIPGEKARLDILRVLCRSIKLDEQFDFQELAHCTPGYVGADLKSLLREAAISALERHLKLNNANMFLHTETNPVFSLAETSNDFRIEMQDFDVALKLVQPSSKREGFVTIPDVTWDDVGALSAVRHELQMSILAPVRYSNDVNRLGLTLSAGILLCGPPGCGKTLLAKAIANESGINFISVKGPELLNMYVGESERAVRAVFTRARHSKPCVIFFDEIDALCPKRNHSESSNVTSRVVNQLLTEMDGLESRNCFMLAATNRPDIVDPAILRPGRFDKVLYVDFPSPDDRYEILWKLTKKGKKPPLSAEVDLKVIAHDSRLDGFTGADLSAVIREASLAALRERIDGQLPFEQEIILTNSHLNFALSKVKPSVMDREHYHDMFKSYSTQTMSNN